MGEPDKRFTVDDWSLIALACMIAFVYLILFAHTFGSSRLVYLIPSFVFVCLGWWGLWLMSRGRRTGPECKICGRRFYAHWESDDRFICRGCRPKLVTPKGKHGQVQRSDYLIAFGLLLVITGGFGFLLRGSFARQFGWPWWLDFLLTWLVEVTVLAVCFVAFLMILVISRTRSFQNKQKVLELARKSAGQPGDEIEEGSIFVWYSRTDNPLPLILDELKLIKGRFESLIGESIVCEHPLRVFWFGKRTDYLAFLIKVGIPMRGFDSIHRSGSVQTFIIDAESRPSRIATPSWVVRSLLAFYCISNHKGFDLLPWLHQGLGGVLTLPSTAADSARLNRKVLTALTRENTKNINIFTLSRPRGMKLFTERRPLAAHEILTAYQNQSLSFVEYLCEEDRRERFIAFYKESAKKSYEHVFERHFGVEFSVMLDRWRAWVLARGVGVHELPPPGVSEALWTQLIPYLKDPITRSADWIDAARGLAGAGYVMGADVLISHVEDDLDPCQADAVWALESISGLALGKDQDAWIDWWNSLPIELCTPTAAASIA